MLEVVNYPGGKNGSGVYQKLINLMPPHDRYFEPFLGSGAVLRMKRPAALNVGIDLVASQVEAVSAEIGISGVAAGITIESDERRRRSPFPTVEKDGGIRYRLFTGCAIAFLEASTFLPGDLVYCDPPYLMETRKGRTLYAHELDAGGHRRLLRAIRNLPCMVMISGYWSKLYVSELNGWSAIHFEAMTRGGYTNTEWVWFNFPRPVELHDYRFLGENYRERERIKRKKLRWTKRLERMPTLERQALLCAIAETTASVGARSQNIPRS